MSWNGIRVTLGCGHMELRDTPTRETTMRWVIGGLSACWVCPARKSRSGGQVAAVRQIVNIEPVSSRIRPKVIGSIHWYWKGEGE